MVFVYPYNNRTDQHFEILQSIALVKAVYPDAVIYTVGKEVPGILCLKLDQYNNIRGCDVTNKMLHFARTIGGDFIYMNKDFFITKNWQYYVSIHAGPIVINPLHATHTNVAQNNTLEFLKHNKFTAYNFETHTPVLMDSKKLLELFENINWQTDNHFIKSIYCNVYQVPSKQGVNSKVSVPSIDKAKEFISINGCFSTGDNFWQKDTVAWIKSLI